jgi:rod shape-determining protein MreD
MRWFAYFILAYLALGLQVGLGSYISYGGVTPNLVLIAGIFIAMNAPRDAALLGCFGMGVMHDLLTHQPPGLFALAYGLVGLMVAGSNQVVYREHPLTHFMFALVGGIVVAVVVLLHGWVHPPGIAETRWVGGGSGAVPATQVSVGAARPSPALEFGRALYTAVLAPLVLGVLQRMKRVFGFQAAKRRAAYFSRREG